MVKKTYTINVFCQNCDYEGEMNIEKGISVQSLKGEKCPICGCKELKSLGICRTISWRNL